MPSTFVKDHPATFSDHLQQAMLLTLIEIGVFRVPFSGDVAQAFAAPWTGQRQAGVAFIHACDLNVGVARAGV